MFINKYVKPNAYVGISIGLICLCTSFLIGLHEQSFASIALLIIGVIVLTMYWHTINAPLQAKNRAKFSHDQDIFDGLNK